jgi:hypothetical protein
MGHVDADVIAHEWRGHLCAVARGMCVTSANVLRRVRDAERPLLQSLSQSLGLWPFPADRMSASPLPLVAGVAVNAVPKPAFVGQDNRDPHRAYGGVILNVQ